MTAAVAAVLAERVGNGNRAALARACGIERTMLTRMLDGKKAITVDELVAICRALGTSPQSVVRIALGRTDGRTDRPVSPEDVTAAPGPDGTPLSARLRDVVTHSEATASGVPSPEQLEELAKRAAEEIRGTNRVKRGRRSGS